MGRRSAGCADRSVPAYAGNRTGEAVWLAGNSRPNWSTRAGVTLIELLCVIALIGILASLLLPAVLRAYVRAREFGEEMEGPGIIEMIVKECRDYCAGHPTFQFSSKMDFAQKVVFAPKADAWVQGSRADFVPFSYLDPTNKIVLSLHYGRHQASFHAFTRGELSLQPP